MITTLDTQNWGKELVTGNGQFVQDSVSNVIYIVSNVRADNSFVILKSDPVPPAPGPGASFGGVPPHSVPVATYTFTTPNSDFDPVVTYDTSGVHPLLHIIGTRNNPTNGRFNDLVKFTYDTVTTVLTGPFVLTTASTVRNGYDMVSLANGHRFVAVSVVDATMFGAQVPPPLQATITQIAISGNALTVTANNTFNVGQIITLTGLTTATFLNGQVVQITSLVGAGPVFTGFTAIILYPNPNPVITAAAGNGTVITITAQNSFLATQQVTFANTAEAFLNGQTVTVATAGPASFTANFVTPVFSNLADMGTVSLVYPAAADTGIANPVFSGENLLAFELDTTDTYIPNSLKIIASSPERSGNTFSSVSLVTPIDTINNFGNGLNIELYYESHPKLFNFKDQLFTINLVNRQVIAEITAISITTNVLTVTANNNFPNGTVVTLNGLTTATFLNGQSITVSSSNGITFTGNFTHADYVQASDTGTATAPAPIWDSSPVNLFTFTARYTDDRLTVLADTSGNRYLSQTFWNQDNHPEGIIGNLLLGTLQVGSPWFFHPIYGSVATGSILDSTLAIAQSGEVNVAYLLQPFTTLGGLPPQGTLPAWQLNIATLDPATLGITNVPGFYNQNSFTWLRGTKSMIDNLSTWSIVGEQAKITTVPSEIHTIPASGIVQVTNFQNYWENVSVIYTATGVPLVEVAVNPQRGQYSIEPSDGNYVFNVADAAASVTISYSYVSQIVPVYESFFNVPPIAELFPNTLTTVYRGQPFIVNGAGTVDADNDPIEYFWTENYPNPAFLPWSSITTYTVGQTVDLNGVTYISIQNANLNNDPLTSPLFWSVSAGAGNVTLTPSTNTAVLRINPAIGGAATTFTVGVAAVDLFPDLITPRHPAANVTAVQITGTTATFTINNIPAGIPLLPFVAGEQVMTYSISMNLPAAPSVAPVALAGAVGGTFYFTVTYLNAVGETLASVETGPVVIAPNFTPQVTSPAPQGDAVAYNVYASVASGGEQLQTTPPIAIGTNWSMPLSGLVSGVVPPTSSSAFESFLNDQILIVLAVPAPTSTSFAATVVPPLGYTAASVPVTGSVIPQFQYAILPVQLLFNAAPTITFPTPAWLGSFVLTATANNSGGTTIYTGTITGGAANAFAGDTFIVTGFTNPLNNGTFICTASTATTLTLNNSNGIAEIHAASALSNTASAAVPRNTLIEITPGTITNPTVQLPVVYSGITDPDDTVTYMWSQVSGTPVTITQGLNNPSLSFTTNGVNILGEDLVFQLILSDGVNPNAVAQCSVPVAAYNTSDLDKHVISRSIFSGNISQRNIAGTWGTLDISALYNDLFDIKRNSVNDGTDRYIVISPFSVLVYGGISPTLVLLRKLLDPTPPANGSAIVDAVHTEADYTIVLDNFNNLYRYSTAPLINTDNPDTTINLSTITSWTFNSLFTTFSFANQRILLLGGPNGLLLMQVSNDTFEVQSFFQISVESNLLYGADNVQFFRTNNVENLRTGQVLVGSIQNARATITSVQVIGNDVIVTCPNSFHVGDMVTLTGLTQATFLNNRTVEVIAATSKKFQFSYNHADYPIGALTLTSVASAISGSAVYTGTITGGAANAYAGYTVTVQGFTNTVNNGTFTCTASTGTTLTLSNGSAVAETNPAEVGLSKPDTGMAVGQNDGNTYETLIDLAHGQIIGTWDSSKLINQFVNTGEILFNPNSAYSGAPLPPVQNVPVPHVTITGTNVTVSWTQFRPDLVLSYTVQYSTDGITYLLLQNVGAGTIQSITVQLATGSTYYFRVRAVTLDGDSNFSNIQTISI